ncbi:MAG: thioesterase family protein [Clostridia bacterium]|jgi:fluoroacetyl-CoA thioesterase|nr:thioesterase family protein [Clostridia bacterium]MBT7121909.1 thioesterase family protein [Clostridia bacterium]
MDSNLKLNLSAKSEQIVQDKDTAKALGSGRAEVFATPRMIALMENAAYTAVQPVLAKGRSTVGTAINAKHLAATPVGIKVWAKATLCEIDRKKLTFTIEAHDETELIGTAVHERFIIDEQKFADKANTKAK